MEIVLDSKTAPVELVGQITAPKLKTAPITFQLARAKKKTNSQSKRFLYRHGMNT